MERGGYTFVNWRKKKAEEDRDDSRRGRASFCFSRTRRRYELLRN